MIKRGGAPLDKCDGCQKRGSELLIIRRGQTRTYHNVPEPPQIRSTMDLNNNRRTRFPGNQLASLVETHTRNNTANLNRRTRFPGGTDTENIRLLEKEKQRIESVPEKQLPVQISSRFPIKVNPPEVVSEKFVSKTSIKTSLVDQLPPVRVESPWNLYISLRQLERGGQVTVAYTRKTPVQMVVVKELLSDNFMELRKCQHDNLLTILEIYLFQGIYFVITDYTAVTLKQVIAIPLPLEELHVSATCRQVLPLSTKFRHFSH